MNKAAVPQVPVDISNHSLVMPPSSAVVAEKLVEIE